MIKDRLREIVEQAFKSAASDGKLGPLTDECPEPIVIEAPKAAEHGDLACGVAMKLARHARSSPINIANTLAEYIGKAKEANNGCIAKFEVANPGFINFRLGKTWLCETLSRIHKEKEEYGKSDIGGGKRVLIEYVSANPTGALHIGHGRGAVFGSCLSNLLQFAGYNVEQEFYVNDTGAQIAQLGACVWACYQRKHGRDVEYPTEGYPEEYLEEYVDELIEVHKDAYLGLSGEEAVSKMADLAKEIIRKEQEELLEKLRIHFDKWFSEESLHKDDRVVKTLETLKQSDYCYEKDGALWLKAEALGDERDRVLKKSNGNFTYLAADAAYHTDKFERGYDLIVNIWGADHHGQVPGLKAVMQALGYDREKLEVILTQIVNLSRDGKIVRMSKRRGTVVMLEEVTDEVGVDAVRYYLAESNPQNPINFDLELAKKTSRENPAFYIQYAHARCCSILRKALEKELNQETGEEEPSRVKPEVFEKYLAEYRDNPDSFKAAFDDADELFETQKNLVMVLASLPQEVSDAATSWQPGKIARFAYDVANQLQKFYECSPVISSDEDATKARLGVIIATKQVLANALNVIGVSAPERM